MNTQILVQEVEKAIATLKALGYDSRDGGITVNHRADPSTIAGTIMKRGLSHIDTKIKMVELAKEWMDDPRSLVVHTANQLTTASKTGRVLAAIYAARPNLSVETIADRLEAPVVNLRKTLERLQREDLIDDDFEPMNEVAEYAFSIYHGGPGEHPSGTPQSVHSPTGAAKKHGKKTRKAVVEDDDESPSSTDVIQEMQGFTQTAIMEESEVASTTQEKAKAAGFEDAVGPLMDFDDFEGTPQEVLERLQQKADQHFREFSSRINDPENKTKGKMAYKEGFMQGIEHFKENLQDAADALDVTLPEAPKGSSKKRKK